MPIQTTEELEELRRSVRQRIIRSIDDALEILLTALPHDRPKHDQLLLLQSRAATIRQIRIGNTQSMDQIFILENELREDVLLFNKYLTLRDFAEAPSVRPELQPGHLLYRVPRAMQLREQHECLIRIAHTLEQVLEGLQRDERTEIEAVPVAEVMQVEIIDPSPADQRAFDILLVSDGEQLVDRYSYTEWVFFVRPLREGQFDLMLKVAVLLTVHGKERTKNIVFRRRIEVQTETVAETPTLYQVMAAPASGAESWSPPPISPRINTRDDAQSPPPSRPRLPPARRPEIVPPQPRRAPAPRLRRWLSVAASLLIIVLAGWWVLDSNSGGQMPTDGEVVDPTPDPGEIKDPDSLSTVKDTLR